MCFGWTVLINPVQFRYTLKLLLILLRHLYPWNLIPVCILPMHIWYALEKVLKCFIYFHKDSVITVTKQRHVKMTQRMEGNDHFENEECKQLKIVINILKYTEPCPCIARAMLHICLHERLFIEAAVFFLLLSLYTLSSVFSIIQTSVSAFCEI